MMDHIKSILNKHLSLGAWLVLLSSSILLFNSCSTTERNCEFYRYGKYITKTQVNDTTYTSTFTRNEFIQIETFNGKTDSSACRWINDCEFVLRTLNPKSRSKLKNIHIKILTTTDSSYTYEYSFVGEKRKETGIAIKIHD